MKAIALVHPPRVGRSDPRRGTKNHRVGTPPKLGLDVAAFDRDQASAAVLGRIQRDVNSGLACLRPGGRHPHPVDLRRRAPPATTRHPAGGTGAGKVIRSRGAR